MTRLNSAATSTREIGPAPGPLSDAISSLGDMTGLAVIGILISGAALGLSAASALFARRQLRLAERLQSREFRATVVAELVGLHRRDDAIHYELAVTNAGPAVARDVDLSIVEWSDARPLGIALSEVDVAPALLRGERREVILRLATADARFDDRGISIELGTDYWDDNGLRNVRLGLVTEDGLILTTEPSGQGPRLTDSLPSPPGSPSP